ncbi:hypothetical protein Dimus_009747 [Dionaea muscipula]
MKLIRRALASLTLLAIFVTTISNGSTLDDLKHYLGGNFFVKDHGAKCDGQTDDAEVIMNTWKLACTSDKPSGVVVAEGTYMAGPLKFEGPCISEITFHIQGTLRAPSNLAWLQSLGSQDDGWIVFQNIDRLTVTGGGTLDGQGERAWKENNCAADTDTCNFLPMNIRFTNVTNALIRNMTSVDSKMVHIKLLECENMTLEHIFINSPLTSFNTDGIHTSRSKGINISDADIKTGNDCISIGDDSQQINVLKVTCGLGDGINVGGLGRYEDEGPISGVTVKNCTMNNTRGGVAVTSWPNSTAGFASGIHFEDIIMNNVTTPPILIDQEYCPYGGHCKTQVPSQVKISSVVFKNVTGTTASRVAVKLECSSSMPCQDVNLEEIDLKYNGKDGSAISQITNVKPAIHGKMLLRALHAPRRRFSRSSLI